MHDTDIALTSFVSWFETHGGYLDVKAINFQNFPETEGGRGMIATKDLQEGHTLFTIPRHLILSTGTSSLPSLFGLDEWKRLGLHRGWCGLILCMMWEQAKGSSSKWYEYLSILPDVFHTPMFWDEEDLKELKGTAVVEKIGKDEVEKDYYQKIIPALRSREDLFPPSSLDSQYSLVIYHAMGSRILSRSFDVENWSTPSGISTSIQDHNESTEEPTNPGNADDYEESTSDEDEDSIEVAMVPMADMLNARFRSENSKLFHEGECLKMVTTKPIKAGNQIWNTYGDLPNAELLRRYGHVDLLPLPNDDIGNPGDVVEVGADLVLNTVIENRSTAPSELQDRIDWWLEEGGDDIIVIESDCEIPAILLSFIRLLLLPRAEWEKVKSRAKPPKAKLDPETLNVLATTLRQRLKQYSTSLEEDKDLLSHVTSLHKKYAVAVRMGEKRIIAKILHTLENMGKMEEETSKRKRLAGDGGNPSKKSSRKM